jgi:hypothetical protein
MKSGDTCKQCGLGRMLAYKSKAEKKLRYLRCDVCRATGKEVQAVFVPRAKRRLSTNLVLTSADLGPLALDTSQHHLTIESEVKNMLLGIRQLESLLAIDFGTARDWNEIGAIPAPVYVGGFARWRKSDFDAWTAAGCPQRAADPDADDKLVEALLLEVRTLKEESAR